MTTSSSTARTSFPVAELERRFYAFAIDRLLSWALYVVVGVGARGALGPDRLWTVLGVVAGTAGLVWLVLAVLLGATGTSPGKSAVGLRVVREGTGEPPGVGPALLRSLVLAVAGLPTFGMGLASLAWTAVEDAGGRRRGWHDHLAHSVVVDVRPVEVVQEQVQEAPRQIVNLTALRLVPAPPVEVPSTPARAPSSELSQRRQPDDVARAAASVPVPPPAQRAPVTPPAPHHQPAFQPPAPPQQPPAFRPPAAPSAARPPFLADSPAGRTVVRGAVPEAQGPARWRVTFDTGESFVVEGLTLVGRRPEPRPGEAVRHVVPLQSADMSVSKTHAQFGPAPDGVIVVMDRGSTNGSVLVRQGVARQLAAGKPATLLPGDKVVFGDRHMVLSRDY
ncbi:hypothetical protein DDE18_03235 [Nocardioides gansuensis]|uniref:FHA domain-containing protein n=1 Tax=Nocardioides gansuensis TaxID=2138300 RepID=A0A2T8FG03_9ACTN|nr:RDD family protein [Nocardioides gansuensis]PVG84629.1 hypothetical protein DDE18_03235 [Nocardioides gansuensis]